MSYKDKRNFSFIIIISPIVRELFTFFIFAETNTNFMYPINESQAEELFENDEKVLHLLAELKWKNGFKCRNCGHTNFCEGKTPHSHRCTKCKKEESATANTLFHNIKFPVSKAFYIAWSVCVNKSNFSTNNYSEMLGINPMTCWKFRKRILKCISENTDSEGEKHVTKILLNYSNFE